MQTYYFQWQNEFLRKTIYPMREVKLRDFLTYYMEIDLWAQYKDKDIQTLGAEVEAYKKAWQANAAAANKEYESLRDYFRKTNVRAEYASKFAELDEAELAEIHKMHALFAQSWSKDIRGEKSFVESVIANWKIHRDGIKERLKSLHRRHENMDPNHPKYAEEGRQLQMLEGVTLPMAQHEMDVLLAFRAAYEKVEERKLAWYKLSKSDPNFKTPEAEFVIQFPADKQITIRDIVYGKIEEYVKSLEAKDQYALLQEIYARFQKEPERFPLWLQYMVVHFSGMRYASAHGSWANPKDLLIRLKVKETEDAIKLLDDTQVEKLCQQKLEQYGSGGKTAGAPKLAAADEPEWKGKAAMHLNSVKAAGPKTKRGGLAALSAEEARYELEKMSTDEALQKIVEMKNIFPQWAWKEVVRFTPLRVNEVKDLNWETLTKEEEAQRNAPEFADWRRLMDEWENHDPSAWRDEHGRAHELIVARAVCNETAEHCQHIRGNLPPGGLAAKPKWYLAAEAEGKPGAYYVKPVSEKDYKQGASILWLRFVDKEPSIWQIAKSPATRQGVGLLPPEFLKKTAKPAENKKAKDKTPAKVVTPWEYKVGEVITRARTIVNPDNTKTNQHQWLRWIHEATVAEVAETADGMMVITYETALPDGDKATSAVGTFKMPLWWHLSDGTEDEYNRSFVGYMPEGNLPLENLKTMLDWDKILLKQRL